MKKAFLVILTGILLTTGTFAQGILQSSPEYIGVNIGYSALDELLPEASDYSPATILVSLPLWVKGRFSVYGELQLTQAMERFSFESDWEFGLNAGIMYQQPLFKFLILTGAIGTGPHFITLTTVQQAKGFIFSDNFELGLVFPIAKANLDLNAKVRYRHISNAGLKEPNGGIDNLFLILGMTKRLGIRR